MAQSMAEHLFEQGKELGEIRAKRDAVLRLLQGRFDALPKAVISRVSAIDGISRLDTIFDEALTAESLDDINWQNGTD